jgi:hypothetical protein
MHLKRNRKKILRFFLNFCDYYFDTGPKIRFSGSPRSVGVLEKLLPPFWQWPGALNQMNQVAVRVRKEN